MSAKFSLSSSLVSTSYSAHTTQVSKSHMTHFIGVARKKCFWGPHWQWTVVKKDWRGVGFLLPFPFPSWPLTLLHHTFTDRLSVSCSVLVGCVCPSFRHVYRCSGQSSILAYTTTLVGSPA